MTPRGTFLAKFFSTFFRFPAGGLPKTCSPPHLLQPGSVVCGLLMCLHVTPGVVLFPDVPLGAGQENQSAGGQSHPYSAYLDLALKR